MQKKNTSSHFFLNQASVLLWCLFFISPLYSFSQAQLGTGSVTIPSTVYLQTSIPVSVSVRNTGDSVFNGPINIYYGTDTTSYTPVLLGTVQAISLSPGDSTSLAANLLIDTTHFFPGVNIVVVWPTGSGITTTTQEWKLIYVDTLANSGVAQSHFDDGLYIYPNPAFNSLYIEYKSGKNHIEEVRIYDLLGTAIPVRFSSTRTFGGKVALEISDIPAGMYFLEIENNAGQRCTRKFVKYGN